MDANDTEVELDVALNQVIRNIGDKKNKLFQSFGRMFQHSDEPKFFQYYAQMGEFPEDKSTSQGMAGGLSFFSQKLAVLKCLSEAMERYALKNYKNDSLHFSPARLLDKPFLDISKIVSFSDKQRELNKDLLLDLNGPFSWVLGKRLPSFEDVYIPAQFIFLSYVRRLKEGFIRLPVTTGAASGTAYSAAIYRGICEVIERDAFMITYLNKLPRSRVPLDKSRNKYIKTMVATAKKYNLSMYCYDISTDLDVYTFLTIIYDSTGVAAAISTGLKSSLNPMLALLGSLQEAFHTRSWLRHKKDQFTGEKSDLMNPSNLADRGALWSFDDTVKHLDFLLESTKETKRIEDYEDRSEKTSVEDMQKIIKLLNDRGYSTYFIDLTSNVPNIHKTNFKVVMTVVPELQPLYLDEHFPYLGGERLYNVPVKLGYLKKPKNQSSLNQFPHPFL